MFLVYCLLGIGWGWLCYKNVQDLLPIQVDYRINSPSCQAYLLQYYLSGLLGFLIIEMLANWGKAICNIAYSP